LRCAGAIPVLFALAGVAQAASLSGSWGVSDPAAAGGQIGVQFDAGNYTFVRDGQRIAQGQYTIRAEEIEFADTQGASACGSPGKYKMILGDHQLTLTKLADTCELRSQALAQTLASTYPADQPQHFEVKFGYTSAGEMKVHATSEVGTVDLALDSKGTFTMPRMRRGDTVRYVSDDGIVTLSFEGDSPHGKSVVTGGEVVAVTYAGDEERNFKSHCSVELTNVAALASFTKTQTAWGDGWGGLIHVPR